MLKEAETEKKKMEDIIKEYRQLRAEFTRVHKKWNGSEEVGSEAQSEGGTEEEDTEEEGGVDIEGSGTTPATGRNFPSKRYYGVF